MRYKIALMLTAMVCIFPTFALRPDYFAEVKARNEVAPYECDKRSLILSALLNNSISSKQAAMLLIAVKSDRIKLDIIAEIAKRLEDPQNSNRVLATVRDDSYRRQAAQLLSGAKAYKAPATGSVKAGFMGTAKTKATGGSTDATLAALEKELKEGSAGLTGPVIADFLREITLSYDRIAALRLMEDKILSMTTKEAEEIIKSFCFPDDKLIALRLIRDRITTSSELATLLDPFSPGVERALAYEILKEIKPASTIYGSIDESTVLFVVDISGSMDAQFNTNGQNFSRLGFVAQELKRVLTQQFTPEKSFNIMVFSNGVSLWKSDFLPATEAHVQSAVSFIESQKASGGTNIYGALERAFQGKKMNGLYFLTDGVPTSGSVTAPVEILKRVQAWNGTRKVPVHTTAFLMGQYGNDNEKLSRLFMKQLADENGGVFRALETIEDMGGAVQPVPVTAVGGASGGSSTNKYRALLPSIKEGFNERKAKTEELMQERTLIKEIPSPMLLRKGWIEEGSCLHDASAAGRGKSSLERRKQLEMKMKLRSK